MWGVTRFGFTSSTSSPLWTLLLALTYGVAGAAALAPLAFNLIAATLVIVTIARFLQARSARPWLACVVLAAAVFVAPLPTLTLTGMEHTVHALATLWFAFAAASILASSRLTTSKELAILAVLAAATTGFRYEGIFAVRRGCPAVHDHRPSPTRGDGQRRRRAAGRGLRAGRAEAWLVLFPILCC